MRRFTTTTTVLGTILLAAGLPALASAQARDFRIFDNGGSRVQFVSDAPLETITGVSSDVSGEVRIDVSDLTRTRGRVAVSVASLRTGIDLRDRHLRSDNWLDAGRHPQAVFEIRSVEGARSLQPGQSARLRIRGRFTIHGITRDVTATGRALYMPLTEEMRQAHVNGDVVVVQARFTIDLEDFGVSIPAPVRLKVSNEIEVNVALRATASDAGRS